MDNTSNNEVQAELARLRAENEKLKSDQAKRQTISFKVSDKGAVSVYGLGRFPVTLYQQQWTRLLGESDAIKTFIEANKGKLAVKE